MPELPEVETIRRGIEKYVVGHVIEDVEVRLKKQFSGRSDDVIGAKVVGVRRFGKGLVIDLDNGYSLAIHVKMTGQLMYRPSFAKATVGKRGGVMMSGVKVAARKVDVDGLPDKYTHVIFQLNNDCVLFYRDMRQFGWIKVVQTEKVKDLAFFKGLGSEPLKDLTREKFSGILKNSRMPIKLLLMDQSKIAGMGNIYVNDSLYMAKIHPKRTADSLREDEASELFEAMESVLRKGLEVGGASEWHYVTLLGVAGRYQNFFQVYRRDGEICGRCGDIIQRMKMGGRGTFYCPGCQK